MVAEKRGSPRTFTFVRSLNRVIEFKPASMFSAIPSEKFIEVAMISILAHENCHVMHVARVSTSNVPILRKTTDVAHIESTRAPLSLSTSRLLAGTIGMGINS